MGLFENTAGPNKPNRRFFHSPFHKNSRIYTQPFYQKGWANPNPMFHLFVVIDKISRTCIIIKNG